MICVVFFKKVCGNYYATGIKRHVTTLKKFLAVQTARVNSKFVELRSHFCLIICPHWVLMFFLLYNFQSIIWSEDNDTAISVENCKFV